jgi:hypothetical protein
MQITAKLSEVMMEYELSLCTEVDIGYRGRIVGWRVQSNVPEFKYLREYQTSGLTPIEAVSNFLKVLRRTKRLR